MQSFQIVTCQRNKSVLNQHNWVATCIPVLIFVQQIMELVPLICSKFHALLILTSLYCQNDLVHGWGLDFALRKCVEVSLITLLLFLAILFHGFNLLLLCVISSTASSWENWGHRFAVDSTSRNSFTREPGKIWLFIYVCLKRWLQQFLIMLFWTGRKQEWRGTVGRGKLSVL